MPMYDYVCSACSEHFDELVKKADTLVVCPKCGAEAKRVWREMPHFRFDGPLMG